MEPLVVWGDEVAPRLLDGDVTPGIGGLHPPVNFAQIDFAAGGPGQGIASQIGHMDISAGGLKVNVELSGEGHLITDLEPRLEPAPGPGPFFFSLAVMETVSPSCSKITS